MLSRWSDIYINDKNFEKFLTTLTAHSDAIKPGQARFCLGNISVANARRLRPHMDRLLSNMLVWGIKQLDIASFNLLFDDKKIESNLRLSDIAPEVLAATFSKVSESTYINVSAVNEQTMAVVVRNLTKIDWIGDLSSESFNALVEAYADNPYPLKHKLCISDCKFSIHLISSYEKFKKIYFAWCDMEYVSASQGSIGSYLLALYPSYAQQLAEELVAMNTAQLEDLPINLETICDSYLGIGDTFGYEISEAKDMENLTAEEINHYEKLIVAVRCILKGLFMRVSPPRIINNIYFEPLIKLGYIIVDHYLDTNQQEKALPYLCHIVELFSIQHKFGVLSFVKKFVSDNDDDLDGLDKLATSLTALGEIYKALANFKLADQTARQALDAIRQHSDMIPVLDDMEYDIETIATEFPLLFGNEAAHLVARNYTVLSTMHPKTFNLDGMLFAFAKNVFMAIGDIHHINSEEFNLIYDHLMHLSRSSQHVNNSLQTLLRFMQLVVFFHSLKTLPASPFQAYLDNPANLATFKEKLQQVKQTVTVENSLKKITEGSPSFQFAVASKLLAAESEIAKLRAEVTSLKQQNATSEPLALGNSQSTYRQTTISTFFQKRNRKALEKDETSGHEPANKKAKCNGSNSHSTFPCPR